MTAHSEALRATEAGGRQLPTVPSREVRRGTNIGRYVVLSRLGAGGMGVVYAAYDPDLDRKIAVKLLHRHQRGMESPASQRLLREAQAMAKLDHPNVITVHDVGTHDGTIFVAMEFVQGTTLRAWLATEPDPAATVDALLQAGRGLAAAHEQGLVHRDFKPDNVMVSERGRVRVMDFGLVRSTESNEASPAVAPPTDDGPSLEPGDDLDPEHGADDAMARVRARMAQAGKLQDSAAAAASSSASAEDDALSPTLSAGSRSLDRTPSKSLTRTGAMLGTPAYMSPEQIGGAAVDARSDQFSFAITAWESLLGERPFQGETVIALTESILSGRREPARSVAGVPKFVVPALTRALSTDPDERYASMNELLEVLGRDPAARRRGLQRAAGAAALVAAAGGVLWAVQPESPCRGARARLQRTWNTSQAARVRRALEATGIRHAAVTADKVDAALDAYGEQWVEAHTEACEATRVRGEQSEAVLDLRMACLDMRFAEFDALVAIVADADAQTVSRATEAAAHLPAIAPCADRGALTRTVDPPRDEETRERIVEVRRQLARASAAEKTGRYDDAAELAATALEAAKALAYVPLTAEASLVEGRVQATLGNTDAAIERLEAAALQGRASGHIEVAAASEAFLTYVVGFSAGRRAEGLAWSRHAEAEVQRLGGDRPVGADLLNHRAVLLQQAGDSEAALADFTTSVKQRERLLGAAHPDTAESRYNLGVLHRQTGRYQLARTEHEAALEIRREVFGPEHPKVADSLMALGSVALREGEPDRARALYDEALELQVAAFGPDSLAAARSHEALATLSAQTRAFGDARTHFAAALAVYEQRLSPDHPRLGRVWMNLGSLEIDAGRPAAARPHLENAAGLFERVHGPQHPELGWTLATLGLAHHKEGDRPQAARVLTRAATILEVSQAEPLVRGNVQADLAEVLAADEPESASVAARTAEGLLLQAGTAGQARLAELRRWYLARFGEALSAP